MWFTCAYYLLLNAFYQRKLGKIDRGNLFISRWLIQNEEFPTLFQYTCKNCGNNFVLF